MNTRSLDPRRSEPQARAIAAVHGAWMDSGPVHREGRDPRLPARGQTSHPQAFRRLEDRQFLDMSRAFGTQGGWVSGDEMSRRMRRCWDQPISVLANWMMKREIVNIVRPSGILIPVFQFNSEDWQIRPVVHAALAELEGVFDDWEIALWFAQPNAWLHEQRPLDLAARDDFMAVHAARADRFIARN